MGSFSVGADVGAGAGVGVGLGVGVGFSVRVGIGIGVSVGDGIGVGVSVGVGVDVGVGVGVGVGAVLVLLFTRWSVFYFDFVVSVGVVVLYCSHALFHGRSQIPRRLHLLPSRHCLPHFVRFLLPACPSVQTITLLFAGQDTSAATLSWTMHLLSLPENRRYLLEVRLRRLYFIRGYFDVLLIR